MHLDLIASKIVRQYTYGSDTRFATNKVQCIHNSLPSKERHNNYYLQLCLKLSSRTAIYQCVFVYVDCQINVGHKN